ncbi:MAG: hypothetical protein JWM19_3701 [Actinomycetia bacterium]|nr:hypothetical protein [Actinomycetes bacterium]
MNRIEELLRAATREGGAQVTPSAIAPLDLTEVPFDRPRFRRRRARRVRLARPGMLVPVLAALAVVAIVAASLALPKVLSSHGRPATSSVAVPDGVPPYYAALTGTGTPTKGTLTTSQPQNVSVRDTWTGEPLATVTPPPGLGTFTFVYGGAIDDRTWVVGASPWKPERHGDVAYNSTQPITFFLLTFEPQYRVIRLRQLPSFTITAPEGYPGAGTPQPVSGGIQAAALSPDGSRLAVAVPEGSARQLVVHVTPLVPGAHGGTWVLPGSLATGTMRNPALSWASDERTLSVATWQDLIFLDTARPSGELLAASRVVPFTGKTPAGTTYACFGSAVMSLDATTMTCAGAPSTDDGFKVQSVGIVTVSARTGVPLRYIPMQRYNAWVTEHGAILYWASPAGAADYVAIPTDIQPVRGFPASLTVWRDGKVAGKIPWPATAATGVPVYLWSTRDFAW